MDDARTTDWLVAWDEARRQGETLSAAELCPDNLERQERLRNRIQELERIYKVLRVSDESSSPAQGSKTIADLDLLEELGRGGMAVVFKARQTELKRIVAVKMILAGPYSRPEQVARFHAEAEVVARLEHPHIVTIHKLGEHEGRPVLVLEYMPGGTLAERYAGAPQPPTEAAKLVEALARAMHHAHGRGIVHRDLKPSNILLTADGVPKVADFGLAKILDDDAGTTWTGDILGTPSYMAPEQAEGKSRSIGPATDVYALGAILYEALTGRPPFQGTTKQETLELVRTQEPVSPRRLQPKISRDLETICLTCLRKEPIRRYRSAEDLAEDLQRSLDGFPIRARRIGLGERIVRWVRRHPTLMAVVAAGLTVLLVLAIAGVRAEGQARRRETASRVRTLVHTLGTIETARVSDHLLALAPYSEPAIPLLQTIMAKAPLGSRERLHAALALLPTDPSQASYLADRLLVATPDELSIIRATLTKEGQLPLARLWSVLGNNREDNGPRLRAACALALHGEADDPRWVTVGPDLARVLAMEDPLTVGQWADLLRPVGSHLLPTLTDLLADDRHGAAERRVLAALYATLARDVPGGFDSLEGRLIEPSQAAIRSEDDRLDAARTRAVVAASLLLMGREDRVWPLLRHTPDPTVRSALIEALSAAGVDPVRLVARFRVERDVSIRRALLLALGEYDPAWTIIPNREALIDTLLAEYRNEPDAGLHSALHWLLDRWGQTKRVRRIDLEMELLPPGDRQWLVNSQGQVFSIVTAPAGSVPTGATGRQAGEHRFALATKEITPYQFHRFSKWIRNSRQPTPRSLAADAILWENPFAKLGPAGREDGPALGILWHEAAAYCNWLSHREGIPEDQWCYVTNSGAGEGLPPLRPAPDLLKRAGYRLPTVAEWTLACSAGASTPSAFGHDQVLLARYGWWFGNAEGHAWPVGELKPNDLGLFDLYGNAWEHCDNPGGQPQRVVCGGSFLVPSIAINLIDTNAYPLMDRGTSVGFRPARTLTPNARATTP
ncbi:bifunctional serine/threonine-protein kinase/formylglycine-generating enzyme family protein [Singulisphaera sp. Ch08]|uniref:non-specific serine/threonine protein kinase n=1 Tax=Singulisphaera sp. Ch08 TaxID=3120278 RepID=A0AAU7CJB6_9BACT